MTVATKKPNLDKANAVKRERRARASKITEALVAASGDTPLDYLLGVMRDKKNAIDVRLDAAKAAAPYVHPKLAQVTVQGGDKPIQLAATVYVPAKQEPKNG